MGCRGTCQRGARRAFRRYARRAGVPDSVWMMDTRARAITEAAQMGVDQFDLRDMAGHTDIATTNKYVRGKSKAISKVVQLRAKK